ncbi:MAG: SH3 domain-containing protein [Anaerolineaceae bacterium]
MSLPTSETTPDGFNSLHPNQRRRLRLLIKNASESEITDFLQDLLPLTRTSLDYFLFLLLSAFVLFLSIRLNSPLLLFVASLAMPFAGPIIGLSISAILPSQKHFIRSLLGLLITASIFFATGWLTGIASTGNKSSDVIPLEHLLNSGWLEWVLLVLAAALTGGLFLCKDELPRLPSALLSYLTFFPLALSGWLLQTRPGEDWQAVLFMGLARLLVAICSCLLTFRIAGLSPRHASGWLMSLLIVTMTGIAMVGYGTSRGAIPNPNVPPGVSTSLETPTSLPQAQPKATKAAASPTPSNAPENTPVPTNALISTPEITTTPILARVDSPSGVVVRAEPNTKAQVVTYLNDGVMIQLLGEEMLANDTLWQKIIAPNGEIGWIVGRYLLTATPTD